MTLPADLAAAQTHPECRTVLHLMDRLESINKRDPYEARRLYFSWKALATVLVVNPEMPVFVPLGYGGTSDPGDESPPRGLAETYEEVPT